jgi:uncharacterized membrane protein
MLMDSKRSTFREGEMVHAQIALLVAIVLQVTLDKSLVLGPRYAIAILELLLVFGIGVTAPLTHSLASRLRRDFSLALIALITLANAASMVLVAGDLIQGSNIAGKQLIFAAFAIFVTNIIIFSIWYWEIDSPGLTGVHKHDAAPKFLFPQMQLKISETKDWEPTYFDYLYLSLTNSTAFSPTDSMPLTHPTKALMGIQALIALLTVVLVTARAVNILG